MRRQECDLLVIGSGFAGSIMARILAQLGYDVVVIERDRHPRFAIGESSTPTADLVLESICRTFGLEDLLPLCRYGSAIQLAPKAVVGPKRGFTYVDAEFDWLSRDLAQTQSSHELLVAASETIDSADTHWHRASVDALIAESLKHSTAELLEGFTIQHFDYDLVRDCWTVQGTTSIQESPILEINSEVLPGRVERTDEAWEIRARGVIDASGRASPLAALLELPPLNHGFQTRSGAVFGHVIGWEPWRDVLDEFGWTRARHPFECDAAALHHVARDGWLWQLPFDNGVTSVGWCVAPESVPPRDEAKSWWKSRLNQHPQIARQARYAHRVEPLQNWVTVPHMQFRRARCAGSNWWMLPSAAGFVDPLHSSGIAHSLVAIERLALGFAATDGDGVLPAEFSRQHGETTLAEIAWIDRLVGQGYRSLHDFREFTLATMPYFAAAIRYETLRAEDPLARPGFLAFDDSLLVEAIDRFDRELEAWRSTGRRLSAEPDEVFDALAEKLREHLRPVDRAGLLDRAAHPYYTKSAAPTKN